MSSAKLVLACGVAALALSACGSSAKPVAGSVSASGKPAGRGVVDDPRQRHLPCILGHHLPAVKIGRTDLQIGPPGSGPKVSFQPTPGAAQDAQISGLVENAEVIGSALLYPNQASDQELQVIEDCLAQGVQG
jgi:hypothetical protein